jgi:hypothetical protein
MNDLFENYRKHAEIQKLSDIEIQEMKCHSFIAFQNIKNSFTMDHRVKSFLEFKKLNESLFLFVDKSPKLCYITKADYDAKLGNLFKNEKFTLIENFVIEKELVDFRKLLRETIGKNVSNIKLLNLNPQNSISEAYGQIKLHKPGYPLRPIVPGHSSLTNNVEKYLKLILTPLLKECTY